MEFEKLKAIIADVLNVDEDEITLTTAFVDDLGADSLDVVELLSRLEDEYGTTIPDEDVENLVTVADVAAEIEKLTK